MSMFNKMTIRLKLMLMMLIVSTLGVLATTASITYSGIYYMKQS